MTPAAPRDAGDRVTHLTWLAPRLLLAIVELTRPDESGDSLGVHGRRGRETLDLTAAWLDCEPDAPPDRPHPWVLAATVPDAVALDGLVFSDDSGRRRVRPPKLAEVTIEPMDFARACLEGFDVATRDRIQGFLVSLGESHGLGSLEPLLAERLAAIRDVVREPLPSTKLEPRRCSARFESVAAIDDYGFWVTGWYRGREPRELVLTAVSPEGARAELGAGAISFQERPDIVEQLGDDGVYSTLGFRGYVELDQPSRRSTGWLLEFRAPGDEAVEDRVATPVDRDTRAISQALLDQLRITPQDDVVLAMQVLPAMVRLRGGNEDPQIERTVDLGALPAAPEISIVIAIRGADRIEHQLGQFARDPELAAAEVVFVAAGGDALHAQAAELAALYEVPFRLVLLSKAARRPRAFNLGVSAAYGHHLVLMGGEVLPDAPGWLGALRACLDGDEEIAAVAPKLLNEDGSIAHAWTEYVPGRGTTRWDRALPFAGLARNVPAANVSRPVLAASDACLMLTARLFAGCGGFSELYLGGDEGIDLCLRIAERGGRTWYVPAAELYNLDRPAVERQSSPVGGRFNDWLLDWRWGTRLAEVAAEAQPAAAPGRETAR